MAGDHMIRASDQDRDVVVNALRDAFTAGRLTLEEFDERTTAAYSSRTWGELRTLTEDLPLQPVLGADVPGRSLPEPVQRENPEPLAGNQLIPPPGQRRRRPVAFFPLVALWIMLALASQSPHVIIAPTVVFITAFLFIALARRR